MATYHIGPMVRAFANRLEWDVRAELSKALAPNTLEKSGADGRNRDDGWPGPMGGGVDERRPGRVNRQPGRRDRDARNLAMPRPRRSPYQQVSPVEAAQVAAHDRRGGEHEQTARHAYKSIHPSEIFLGHRGLSKRIETGSGCCALYSVQDGDGRSFIKRSNTGALRSWQAMQCEHGELLTGRTLY